LATDPRFRTNGDRVANRPALTALLSEAFAGLDGHALTLKLLRGGVPAGPVLGVDEAMAADHTAHREMVAEIGDYRALGTPIKLSRTPGGMRAAPPKFAEHTDEVLAAHGFTPEEIEGLEQDGVLFRNRNK